MLGTFICTLTISWLCTVSLTFTAVVVTVFTVFFTVVNVIAASLTVPYILGSVVNIISYIFDRIPDGFTFSLKPVAAFWTHIYILDSLVNIMGCIFMAKAPASAPKVAPLMHQ